MCQSNINTQARRYQAFTTIELLVVIGILVVLAAIVFVGVHKVGRPAKENATQATLANLQGMLADLETAGGGVLRKQPPDWLWTEDGSTVKRRQAGTFPAYDFWKGPSNAGTTVWSIDYALASPGAVADDGVGNAGNQRHGSIAIVNTDLAMSLMASLPDNKSRLQSLQQNQTMIPAWHSGPVALPNGNATIQFVPGNHVTYQGHQFVASQTMPTGGNPTPAPNTNAEWIDVTGKQQIAPLLLDAWNNPIIFVPATGLRVRLKQDPSKEFIVLSPEGEANNAAATPTIVRPGRPFFASAGADGDFTAGDDNVYSFDK